MVQYRTRFLGHRKSKVSLWKRARFPLQRDWHRLAAEKADLEINGRGFQIQTQKDTETEVITICSGVIGKVNVSREFIWKIYNISLEMKVGSWKIVESLD